ncbi:MAG: glutathione S-transferase family protein [Sulfitobacter sp.]
MIFYDCKTAPSPRRARMFLAEKGIDIETREVSIGKGEQLSPEFLAVNPRATVPVLVTDDGTKVTENVAIAAYLEEKFPETPLMGTTAEERALVLMWNAICESQGGLPIADALRNSNPHMKGRATTGPVNFDQIPELAARGMQRAAMFFDLLEERLSESTFLAGDTFTMADITGFVFCDFARVIKMPIRENCPATQKWFAGIKQRASASA